MPVLPPPWICFASPPVDGATQMTVPSPLTYAILFSEAPEVAHNRAERCVANASKLIWSREVVTPIWLLGFLCAV